MVLECCFQQRNAEQFYRAMSDIKGLKPIMPAGAMYMMVSYRPYAIEMAASNAYELY